MERRKIDERKWHLGKVIDLPTLIAILLQTTGVIWYGAQLAKTVELQGSQIAEISVKVNKLVELQARAETIEHRIRALESELSAQRLKAERVELELTRVQALQPRR
jgi:cell division protein FtsB